MWSNDRRDTYRPWFDGFDQQRMVLTVTLENDEGEEIELEFPAKFEVCDMCEGKGSHVNPSIDAHGLSREDFDEDPDFREQYFSGFYDVPCVECDGRRVSPVIDEDRCTPEQKANIEKVHEREAERAAYAAECAAERRMGA